KIYVADSGNHLIRRIDIQNNAVTTWAGQAGRAGWQDGEQLKASFNFPQGLAIDNNGNLFVADTHNNLIRKISQGQVTTLLGNGRRGNTSDELDLAENLSTDFALALPAALAYDDTLQLLFIADTFNQRILILKENREVNTLIKGFSPGSLQVYAKDSKKYLAYQNAQTGDLSTWDIIDQSTADLGKISDYPAISGGDQTAYLNFIYLNPGFLITQIDSQNQGKIISIKDQNVTTLAQIDALFRGKDYTFNAQSDYIGKVSLFKLKAIYPVVKDLLELRLAYQENSSHQLKSYYSLIVGNAD
nr:hypothetical protein [Candidatus Gracilibacteria bacterium]